MRVKARGVAAYLRLDARTAGCTVEDISAGGMFLRTDRVVPVGTHLSFDLVDPEQKKAVTLSATVVGIILKEAADRRGVPQGLRLKFNRQPGATQAYLQRLLGRLGAPQSDAPVFYAVTQQPPRAKVDLPPAGGSLPKLRREPPPDVRVSPPRLEGAPIVYRAAGSDAPESTRAAPAEEAPSPLLADEEEGAAPVATDTALEGPAPRAPPMDPALFEDPGTIPELKRPIPSADLDATNLENEVPRELRISITQGPPEAKAAPRSGPDVKRPNGVRAGRGREEGPPPSPAVEQLDASGVLHDVTAYRAAIAAREARARSHPHEAPAPAEQPVASELLELRRKVATLEEALRAREERISDLEAEVRSLRYVLDPDGPRSLGDADVDGTRDWTGAPEEEADTEAPADDPTPVPAPAPRRKR